MNPLISCIVPVLNESNHITRFISSMLSQKYRPIELIMIDGGSIDETISKINEIIDSNKDHFFLIKLFHELGTYKSPANAKNIGLNHANGEFILIIDADSMFIREDTITTALKKINDDNSILIKFCPVIDTELEQFISSISKRSGVILYKSDFIQNTRFLPSLGFGEDRVFQYKLFGDLEYSGEISTSQIGRHYPHTMKEYAHQNEWYGKTILNYIKIAAYTNVNDMFAQIIFVIYNLAILIFPPVCLFRIYRNNKYKCKTNMRYGILSKIWYSYFASVFFSKGLAKYFIQTFKNIR